VFGFRRRIFKQTGTLCLIFSRFFVCAFILTLTSLPSNAVVDSWQNLLAQGDIYINQQKLIEAENCFRRAVKTVQHQKPNSEDKAKCMEKLAATLVLENKTEEGMNFYRKALNITEEQYGKYSPKLVPIFFALGSIFESEGDPKKAMDLYSKAVAINEKNYGAHSLTMADSLHRLGRANFGAGNIEQAEASYKQSLSILMEQPGLSSSKELENLLSDYGDLLKKNEALDKNLLSDFQKEILKDRHGFPAPTAGVPPSAWQKEIATQTTKSSQWQNNEEQQIILRGFKQPFTESTLEPTYKTVANVLRDQNHYKQGEDYYERMIAIDIKALGSNHPAVADDLTGLAMLYISQKRYAEAKPVLLKAMAIYQEVYGNDNLLVARTRQYLALVYTKLGDTESALALYAQAFKEAHTPLQPGNLEAARMLNELAYLYYSQGRLEDACTMYQWALASTKAAVGAQNILVAACLTDYANVLSSAGRNVEAKEMSNQATLISLEHDNKGIEKSNHE